MISNKYNIFNAECLQALKLKIYLNVLIQLDRFIRFIEMKYVYKKKAPFVKFIYSKKATQFCEIATLLLSYVVPVKSKVEISQKDLGQKMTPVKVRDVLIKSWLLSPENGPQ